MTPQPGTPEFKEWLDRLEKLGQDAPEGPYAYEFVEEKANTCCVGVVIGEDGIPLQGQIESGQGILDETIACEVPSPRIAEFITAARNNWQTLLDGCRLVEQYREDLEQLPHRCQPIVCRLDEDRREAGEEPDIGWLGPSLKEAVAQALNPPQSIEGGA